MSPWIYLIIGLGLLYGGAQALLKGGASLAIRMGLSSLAVGLTVMAYGTSSPELVVSIEAGLSGKGAISAGNVVGSNICNILLILGAAALVHPIATHTQVIRREIPLMIAASVLAIALLADGTLSRLDGSVLLAGIVAYTWLTLRDARRAHAASAEKAFEEEAPSNHQSLPVALAYVLGGLGVLVVGSHLFVDGAAQLAEGWGISQAVIGLTVVAIGTSLPELATSMVAALHRNTDVAIGNVVGSNLFNLLGILGIAALVNPIDVSDIGKLDLAVMLATAVFLLPMIQIRKQVGRREGVAMLAAYALYTWWLIGFPAA
jgi:cation:H+ antiporter